MSPPQAIEEIAKKRLAGVGPTALASGQMPERLRKRVEELVADLEQPAKRAVAIENLRALGAATPPVLANVFAREVDAAVVAVASELILELGPKGAPAAPGLVASMPRWPVANAAVALRTLAAVAPWWDGAIAPVSCSCDGGEVALDDHVLPGMCDMVTFGEILNASEELNAAIRVDPEASSAELQAFFADPDYHVVLRALALARERGSAAKDMLPLIAGLVRGPARRRLVPGPDPWQAVRSAAARAIVAIADPADPVRQEAETFLANLPGK